MSAVVAGVRDGMVITKRNLIKIKRVPDLLVFTTIQPIMFVLLFAYVFGGAISVERGNYREFLMAGIFAQTLGFGSTITATGLAEDMHKGMVDRFRSLPMSRAAVLIGRTTSDLINNVIVVTVMSLCGLVVGWRIHNGFGKAVAAYALLLLFAYSLSWVSALIGLSVRSVEVANNAGFLWVFPLTFIANTFVPLKTLPKVLQAVAEWSPVTCVVSAARDLFGNSDGGRPTGNFATQHPAAMSLIWSAAILAVFIPLAVRKYKKSAAR